MGYFNNVKKQYWISLFHSLIPAYVIERLFWQERGMNVQMVVYCEIVYAVTVIIMEIPSGILADYFGRKKLLVISGLFGPIEFMILLSANSFLIFALAIFLSGLGKALSSGSENALLYDSLLAENKQDSFEKITGRIYAIDFGASAIAALCGSVLAYYFNFELNYIISTFSMLVAFMFSLSLKEPPIITKPESELTGAMQYTKQALSVFRKKPLVLLYCITGAFLGACTNYLDEFWQLVLDHAGIPVIFFGAIGASFCLLRVPGNLFAWKLKERFHYRFILRMIILINSAGYILISLTNNVLCFVPIMIVPIVIGIADPLISGYLHHNTESHIRATVESISSLLLRLLTIVIGLVFGYLCTSVSILAGFAFLGGICFFYLIFYEIAYKS